jgi:endonuclease G
MEGKVLRFLLVSVLIGFAQLNPCFAKIEVILGKVPLDSNVNIGNLLPSTSESEIILSRNQYVISYNKNRRSPNWVAWKLEANQLGRTGRTNNFSIDTELDMYLSRTDGSRAVDPDEYKGSCFDRGHQVPSGDRTDTVVNNEATFEMSNMIPQTPYLNRVIWEHLEQYTRDMVRNEGKKVYMIAGPIYDEDFGVIGPDRDIPVPSKNFKIIVILDANQTFADINKNTQMIAVVMPNVLEDGTKPINHADACKFAQPPPSTDHDDWQKYQTTVSEIERLSGLKISSLH